MTIKINFVKDQAQLYIFTKREIGFIFIIVILIQVTSFIFGIKIGKNYSYKSSGYIEEDRESLEPSLPQEQIIVKEKKPKILQKQDKIALERTLKEKFDKEFGEHPKEKQPPPIVETKKLIKPTINNDFSKKYTIQLASYRSLKEAKEFANGFKVRGYNPIINEVDLGMTGSWFRVSLGVFDSLKDTKKYLEEEKTLFYNLDPLLIKFDQ